MPTRSTLLAITASVALAAPAFGLLRLDTFAGRGYRDGGPATAATVFLPADAVTDAAGNVYFSDSLDELVRRVDAAGNITSVAGNGSIGSAGDGGPATLANLHDPNGLALDPAGQNLYIAENEGERLRKVDLTTGIITTIAGTGFPTGSIDGEGGNPLDDLGDGGPAVVASFNQPIGVAVATNGDIYVSERSEKWANASQHSPRIRRIDAATGIIQTFAGGLPEGYNGEGHAASATALADPIGMQFDGSGNLYFGELGNNRIRKIKAGDHTVTTVAGVGMFPEPNDATQVPFEEGVSATLASLHRPVRVGLLPRGCGGPSTPPCEIYFGDSGHHCVRKIGLDGKVVTVVNAPPNASTSPSAGDSGDGGPGAAARLLTPAALLGPNNTVVIVDDSANRLRLFDPAAGTIRGFAGTGEGGFGGDGGPAARALLNRPAGIAHDAAGNVYVTEHDNHRIRRIAPDAARTITTYAGTGEQGAGGDGGPAIAATFQQPTGITFTPAGDLLVTDAQSQVVRRIDVGGIISRFAGIAGLAGVGGDGGQATAAALNTPLRTAVMPGGDVLIADYVNNRVRRVDASGIITTFATGLNPAGLAIASDGTIFASDFAGERIVTIDGAGAVHPFAGTGVATGSGGNPDRGDGGPASAATFSDPTGVSFDVDGALLVADQGNNLIRRIALDGSGHLSPASIVSTIIGDGRPAYGGDGGNALFASLNRPTEAVALPDGRILVADRGNQQVRVAIPVQSLCDVTCEDGDPCTIDSCDPNRGCSHMITHDSDGDGICDAADNCPDVPNANQDPGACLAVGAACASGDPACIPGTGARATECLVETVVRGARGVPAVTCMDGDPSCDADPAAGRCGFSVAWCFNEADPRLAACHAVGLKRITVRARMSPRSAAQGVIAAALSAAGDVTGGALHGSALVMTPPFAQQNRCTRVTTVSVPLHVHGKRTRRGRAALVVMGKGSGRGRDVDRLKLTCVPHT